ncbi:MAG: heavy metal-binding domain-containing protein [Bdellovibrionales bacterium]|nr:heavy metal-binding domain-containing protein [Bdellovibrionales bacterium]
MDVLIPLLLLVLVGYVVGTWIETQHFKNIRERERRTRNLPALTMKLPLASTQVSDVTLVSGSVVVSVDYFKRFVMSLIQLVGGRISSYETLMDRARREAQLRMKEQAMQWGATSIVNLRMETSTIANQNKKNNLGTVEVLAYGTAIKARSL